MQRLSILLFALLLSSAVRADGVFAFGVPSFGVPSSLVANLPACNGLTNGVIYTVTNALAPTIAGIVVGGGAVTLLVHCNGTNWVVG